MKFKNAVLLSGAPSKVDHYDPQADNSSRLHWFPWLSRQLVLRDILAVSVELPMPFSPTYEAWKTELERYDVTPETLLVGHSCGGGFLLRWLSENPEARVGRVILVAPWTDPLDEDGLGDFFDFELDPELSSRVGKLTVFSSKNEWVSGVKETVQMIEQVLPDAELVSFDTYGHFCESDLNATEFPELLEECLDSPKVD